MKNEDNFGWDELIYVNVDEWIYITCTSALESINETRKFISIWNHASMYDHHRIIREFKSYVSVVGLFSIPMFVIRFKTYLNVYVPILTNFVMLISDWEIGRKEENQKQNTNIAFCNFGKIEYTHGGGRFSCLPMCHKF